MPRRSSRVRRVVGVLLVVLGLLGTGRVAWVALAPPPGEGPVPAQVAHLRAELADGAAADMQALFPEGAFFSHALTGLAAADGDPDLARDQLAAIDDPAIADAFGAGLDPDHGIFHAGWSLALAVEIATATRTQADLDVVAARAPGVLAALTAAPTGVPASYPGGYWPCDAVVAGAAVAAAAQLLGEPSWTAQLGNWRDRLVELYDPALGLLPHRVDAAGVALDGPRGSSQSIIQVFWPTLTAALDGAPETTSWVAFRAAFVVRVAGLVGVREHPVGVAGGSDVDSGPLLAGVSLSASAVTLGAARANRDAGLAADLDRQAELLGMPLELGGARSYALGQVPVGDAFLAWARSVPLATDHPMAAGPRTLWVLLALPSLLAAAAGALLLRSRRRS